MCSVTEIDGSSDIFTRWSMSEVIQQATGLSATHSGMGRKHIIVMSVTALGLPQLLSVLTLQLVLLVMNSICSMRC